jgi:hypothetical protein
MGSTTKPHLDPVEKCAKRVLELVMRLYDLTDGEVARRLGLTAQAIQQRRTGAIRIRPGQVSELARALDLPQGVFGMEPPDVLRYFADRVPVEKWTARDSNPEPTVGGVVRAFRRHLDVHRSHCPIAA